MKVRFYWSPIFGRWMHTSTAAEPPLHLMHWEDWMNTHNVPEHAQ